MRVQYEWGTDAQGPLASLSASLVATLVAPAARADDPVDLPAPVEDPARHQIDRTWLYTDDARVAAPMTVIGTTSLSYTSVSSCPSRIVTGVAPAGCACALQPVQRPRGQHGGARRDDAGRRRGGARCPACRSSPSAQVGLGGHGPRAQPEPWAPSPGLRLQLLSPGVAAPAPGGQRRLPARGLAGPRLQRRRRTRGTPGSPERRQRRLGARCALRATSSRVRLAGTVHGEHVFADYRDPRRHHGAGGGELSRRRSLPRGRRVRRAGPRGDLRQPPRSDGARHLLGPIASVQLLGDRFTLVSVPRWASPSRSPDFVHRLPHRYGF